MKRLTLLLAWLFWAGTALASTPTAEPAIVLKSGQFQQQPGADCLSIRSASGSDWLCQGSGAPAITTAPPGSLYHRDDIPLTYILENNNTTAARVQEATATETYAVTLGSTPVVGDVLYAYAYRQGATPTIAAGWTSVGTHSTTDVGMLIACRPVQSGDGKTFTIASGSGNTFGAAIIEVSGVNTGNCASNQSLTYNSARVASGANNSSTNFTTTTNNTLAIGFSSFVKETNLGANSQTITTGFTNISQTIDGSGNTWSSTVDVGSQQVASSSTAITLTDTSTYSGSVANEVEVALLILPSQPNNWVLLSKLATVQSGGVTITPAGASARQLNFSTGLSATDDGNGNETVTSAAGSNFAANTVWSNWTSGSAAPQANTWPSCTDSGGNHLNYVNGTGVTCGTAYNLTPTFSSITDSGMAGGGTLCVHVNNSGALSTAAGDCAAGGSGSVTSVVCGLTTITTSGNCTGVLIAIQRFTTHQTVTPTYNANTQSILIKLIGAGGGGRSVAAPGAGAVSIGDPGSGGAYCEKYITGRANFVGKQLIVGTGGAGGAAASPPNSGANGTATSFDAGGANYSAGGGGGGITTDSATYGWIVVAAVAGGASSNCDLNVSGAPSGMNLSVNTGSGPSASSVGGNSAGPQYGVGGVANAIITTAVQQGGDATGNGAGGSGGISFNGNTPKRGGNGGDGYAEILEYQ